MPGGHPTHYKPEYAEQLLEYIADPEVVFPTKAGFAIKIGVCRDTLHEWANTRDDNNLLKHPEFSDAYKRVVDFQEVRLTEGALSGKFQPAFSIFTAKNVLGWRDKQDIEHSGAIGVHFDKEDAEL